MNCVQYVACVCCGRQLYPICSACDQDQVNKGLKRSFTCISDGERSNDRLFQRQRTAEIISNVSNQVGELTINDPESSEGAPMVEYVEEVMRGSGAVIDALSSALPYGEVIAKFFKVGEEIVSLHNKAEHNKEICGFFTVRVNAAMSAVRDLRGNENLFMEENFKLFKEFVHCMKKIKQYVSEISQLGRLKVWLQGSLIEQKFKDLTTEFEGYMQSLKFTLDLQYSHDLRSSLRMVAKDVREVKEFLSRVKGGIADSSNQNISSKIPQVLKMNLGFRKHEFDSHDSISSFQLLNAKSYEKASSGHRKRITKRYNPFREEVAFKEFTITSSKSEKEICQQVKILEHLSQSQHIIRFYGIVKEELCYFLVTEWMENGNLLEFYEKHPNFSWEKKFDFALDICRGLIFLNAVQIFHHDLRGANMLVDKNLKVKVANFGLSRRFNEITRNIKTSLETMRYMAPEKLIKGEDQPYDIKCEIYSLGVLLWEIAEEKVPYSNSDLEFATIRDHVIKNKREPLSHGTPEIWKSVVGDALQFDPDDRPAISVIFNKLHKYTMSQKEQTVIEIESDGESVIELDICNISAGHMSVQEAINEHKRGNKQKAWECFSHHAGNGDMLAKYWVGYYLYYSEIGELKKNAKENLVRAAQLFKETADNGKPEGQLRYGTCLWLGKGVKTNYNEAIRYLTSAADSGNVEAMYNVGGAYYNGTGVEKNSEKGATYLRAAAKRKNIKAIEVCKKYGIDYLNTF
ncbi:8856_t:CDS:2 [Acaulospora morrowiae]|uniref:8856_t:CDS:1 n=1 Tax=Acaulospora morrowiae TaxID=94023 RepID=A0A9N9H0B5_9GLOM|nr:8856_t:CDS:2 [Acaulospora morrowiae]